MKFLGHVVSSHGVATDPAKVDTVEDWLTPRNLKDLRTFLGTIGYYHQYIEDYTAITRPLSRLTQKNTTWEWTREANQAFRTQKQRLTQASVLDFLDPTLPYLLNTDASQEAVR